MGRFDHRRLPLRSSLFLSVARKTDLYSLSDKAVNNAIDGSRANANEIFPQVPTDE